MKNPVRSTSLVLAATMSLLLGACTVTPTYGPRYVEVVTVEPPPPRVEIVGPPPIVGHIWISGYWNWGGGRYVWVPGRWEAPHPGQVWVPHRWERDGDRWRQSGGHWQPDERRAPPREERHERRGEERMPVRPAAQEQAPMQATPATRPVEMRDEGRRWSPEARPDGRREMGAPERQQDAGPRPERRERDWGGQRGNGNAEQAESRRDAPREARDERSGRGQSGNRDERSREGRGRDRDDGRPG